MKSPALRVLDAIQRDQISLPQYREEVARLSSQIGGWSNVNHYLFFSAALNELTEVKSILILGVYMGRDISFMSSGCKRELQIVGVDKFADTPCADWPDKNVKSWTEAGYGTAPSLEVAQKNLAKVLPPQHHLRLIEADDSVWLDSVEGKFSLIYIDTAHDKATVQRQLKQIRKLCHADTLIAGDDYENIEPTWGVKDAVTEGFKEHHVLGDSIWWANAGDLV